MLHRNLQNIDLNMMQACLSIWLSFSTKIITNSIIVSVSGLWFCFVSWPSVASSPALSHYFCRQESSFLKPFPWMIIFSPAEPIAGTPRASTTTPPSRGRKVATNNNQVEEPGLVDLTLLWGRTRWRRRHRVGTGRCFWKVLSRSKTRTAQRFSV